MALPTASTYGYGYMYTIGPTPDVACNCLREWLPALARAARKRGIIGSTENLAVWQCTGGLSASGGTHYYGGAFDLGLPDAPVWSSARTYKKPGPKTYALIMLAREMGAPATWPRIDTDGRSDGDPWEGNQHIHGVLYGCPHLSDAAKRQYSDEYFDGEDGLVGSAGDTMPRPSALRTWKQGLAWAEGTTTTTTTTGGLTVADINDILAKLNTLTEKVNSISGKVSSVDEITLGTKLPGADNATVGDVLVATWAGEKSTAEKVLGTRLPGAENARIDEILVALWRDVRELKARQ